MEEKQWCFALQGALHRVPGATFSNHRPPELANFRSKTCVGVADPSVQGPRG
jgi:hypothetical protein